MGKRSQRPRKGVTPPKDTSATQNQVQGQAEVLPTSHTMNTQPPIAANNKTNEHKRDAWDWVKLGMEFLAFVALVIYTCETRRTNDLTQASMGASAEATRMDQRAWVGLKHMEMTRFTANDSEVLATTSIGNSGKTLATAVQIHWAVGVADVLWEASAVDDWFATHHWMAEVPKRPLFPGGETIVPTIVTKQHIADMLRKARFNPATPEAAVDLIRKNTAVLFVISEIDYTDVFKSPHKTIFCVAYDPNHNTFRGCLGQHDYAD